MSEIEQIKAEIARTIGLIEPLQRSLISYQERLRQCEAADFIRVNRVSLENTENVDQPGMPYFGVITDFAKWLAQNSVKRFATWNGRVYFSADLIAGRMPETPVHYADLKQQIENNETV